MNIDIKALLLADEETFLQFTSEFTQRLESKWKKESEWISEAEAMEILCIKSKTTLWKLRSTGAIMYSAISTKHFLYSRSSILDFINAKRQETF